MAFSLFLHDCKLCIKPVTSSFQSIYDPGSDSFRRQQSYWENTSFYITPQTAVTQVHVTLQTLLINVLSRRREALLLDVLMRWDWYDRQMLLCSDSSLLIKTVRIILSFWFFYGYLTLFSRAFKCKSQPFNITTALCKKEALNQQKLHVL